MNPRASLTPFLAALALLLALPGGRGVVSAGAESSRVPEARVESFVLEDRTAGRSDLVGFAQWRRRDAGDGPQLEREIRFLETGPLGGEPAPDTVVLHVEGLSPRGARLVWRELQGGGRALLAEWSGEDVLRLREWGTCARGDFEIARPANLVLPLYLDELVRTGRIVCGSVSVFDPRTRAACDVEVRTVFGDDGGSDADKADLRQRTVELRRDDGTLFERLRFVGAELVGFQLQDGGPWARRVPSQEYEARRGERSPTRRAAESDRAPRVGG